MPITLETSLLSALVGLAGAAIGWFIRGYQLKIERRVQEELWMRKLRLAEQDQQKALQVMRQSTVEVKAHQRRVDEAAELIGSQDEQLAGLKGRMEARDREVKQKDEEAIGTRERASSLERALDELREKLTKAQGAHDLTRTELSQSEQTRREQKLDLEQIPVLQGQFEELRGTLGKREAELKKLAPLPELCAKREREVKDLNAQAKSSASQFESANSKLVRQLEELKPFKVRTAKLDKELAQRQSELAEREQEVQEWVRRNREVATEAERNSDELTERIAKLDAQVGDLKPRAKSLNEQLTEGKAELEAQASKLAELESDFAAHRDSASETRSALEARVAELEPNLELVAEQSRALDEHKTEFEQWEKRLRTSEKGAEKKTGALEAKLEKLTVRTQEQKEASELLTKNFSESQKTLQAVQGEFDRARTRVHELEPLTVELETRSKELDYWKQKFNEQHEENNAETATLRTRVKKLEDVETRHTELKRKQQEVEARMRRAEKSLASRESQLENLRAKLETSKTASKESKDLQSAAKIDARNSAKESSILTKRVTDLEKQLAKREAELNKSGTLIPKSAPAAKSRAKTASKPRKKLSKTGASMKKSGKSTSRS